MFGSPSARTLRDPFNCANDLREVRERDDFEGYDWITFHTFRKTVATRMDEAGLTAREIADQLGHAKPSMTQDVYMGRKVVTTRPRKSWDRFLSLSGWQANRDAPPRSRIRPFLLLWRVAIDVKAHPPCLVKNGNELCNRHTEFGGSILALHCRTSMPLIRIDDREIPADALLLRCLPPRHAV